MAPIGSARNQRFFAVRVVVVRVVVQINMGGCYSLLSTDKQGALFNVLSGGPQRLESSGHFFTRAVWAGINTPGVVAHLYTMQGALLVLRGDDFVGPVHGS